MAPYGGRASPTRQPLQLVTLPFGLLLVLYGSLLLLTAVYMSSTSVNSLADGRFANSFTWAQSKLPAWSLVGAADRKLLSNFGSSSSMQGTHMTFGIGAAGVVRKLTAEPAGAAAAAAADYVQQKVRRYLGPDVGV